MNKTLPYFFIIIMLGSCLNNEIAENLDIESNKTKLVVYGLISPEKSSFINVRLTKGFDEPNSSIDDLAHDAEVILVNELGETVTLIEKEVTGNYYIDKTQFPIEKGKEYKLEVSYKGLSVTAKCKVPHKRAKWNKFNHSKIEEIIQPQGGDYITTGISGKWINVSTVSKRYFYTTGFNVTESFVELYAGFYLQYDPYEITMLNDTVYYQSVISYNEWIKGYYYLITMEENFYDFLVASSKMEELVDPNLGNFLISYKGILPEFTNIEGGVGFFGAYLTDSVYFEME